MEFNYSVSYYETGAEMNIATVHTIVFLDIAVIVILFVLAYLSKRLGEALKTPPYYKLFYIGVIIIAATMVIHAVSMNTVTPIIPKVSNTFLMGIRFLAGFLAVIASLQYWRWLFSEFIKR